MMKKDLPTKVCSRCRAEKDKAEFYKQTSHSDRLQAYCKRCAVKVVVESRRTKRNERRQALLSQGTK